MEVEDFIRGEEVDLTDALHGAVANAPADGGRSSSDMGPATAPAGHHVAEVGLPSALP